MSEEDLREASSQASSAAEAQATVGALDPRDELAQKDKQLHDLEGQYRRMAADFDNYRRRQNTEREELVKFASSRVIEELLPVVDNFERAIAAAKGATDVAKVVTGVEQIYRLFVDALTRQGVATMDAAGKVFDPNLHEAISQVENTTVPDQTVLIEIQKGYFLNGKVLRHAMVQVANNPNTQPNPEAASGAQAPVTPSADADKEDHHE